MYLFEGQLSVPMTPSAAAPDIQQRDRSWFWQEGGGLKESSDQQAKEEENFEDSGRRKALRTDLLHVSSCTEN